jgi:hypothetical protein
MTYGEKRFGKTTALSLLTYLSLYLPDVSTTLNMTQGEESLEKSALLFLSCTRSGRGYGWVGGLLPLWGGLLTAL